MNIEKFKPAIVYTIYIASTPEKVWAGADIGGIQPKIFLGQCRRGRSESRRRLYRAHAGWRGAHLGEVIECDPLRKLTVTFNVNWPALIEKLGPTLVTYEIEPVGDVVKLTLIQSHDRPISDDILSGGRAGWPAILSSLKSLLETGSAMVIQMQPPQRMLAALKELGIGMP